MLSLFYFQLNGFTWFANHDILLYLQFIHHPNVFGNWLYLTRWKKNIELYSLFSSIISIIWYIMPQPWLLVTLPAEVKQCMFFWVIVISRLRLLLRNLFVNKVLFHLVSPCMKLSGLKSSPMWLPLTLSIVPGSKSTSRARGTYFPPKITQQGIFFLFICLISCESNWFLRNSLRRGEWWGHLLHTWKTFRF